MSTINSNIQGRFIAVIDLGKTNAKVAVVDTDNLVEIEVFTRATPGISAPGYTCLDVETIWDFIIESLSTVSTRFTINAIGVTTHGATACLTDSGGHLVLPVMDYESPEPDQLAQAYSSVRPPFSETGSPRLPAGLNIGAQLFWLDKTYPDKFRQAHYLLMYTQYWVHRLCGVFATDVTSLGCHTDLINPTTLELSSLMHRQQWANLVPGFCTPGEKLGNIKNVAQATGLASDTAVLAGIHDSNASLVPYLRHHSPPYSVVSTGTWTISMSMRAEKVHLDSTRDTLMNINADNCAVPTARFMGGREYHELKPANSPICKAGTTDGALPNGAIEVIKSVVKNNAMLLPAVKNDSGPYQGKDAQWSVAEQHLSADERDVCIAFYLALMTSECLGLIAADGPTHIEGPFASNAVFLLMLGVVTSRDVYSRQSLTGTSIGTAMLHCSSSATPESTQLTIPADLSNELLCYAKKWKELAETR